MFLRAFFSGLAQMRVIGLKLMEGEQQLTAMLIITVDVASLECVSASDRLLSLQPPSLVVARCR
jgi:hypothetical protein